MIEITVKRSERQMTADFSGHAGYAEPGRDIVCAAVSALFYALIAGVERIDAGAVAVNGTNVTVTKINPEIKGAVTAVFAGLNAIEEEYQNCIRIHVQPV